MIRQRLKKEAVNAMSCRTQPATDEGQGTMQSKLKMLRLVKKMSYKERSKEGRAKWAAAETGQVLRVLFGGPRGDQSYQSRQS